MCSDDNPSSAHFLLICSMTLVTVVSLLVSLLLLLLQTEPRQNGRLCTYNSEHGIYVHKWTTIVAQHTTSNDLVFFFFCYTKTHTYLYARLINGRMARKWTESIISRKTRWLLQLARTTLSLRLAALFLHLSVLPSTYLCTIATYLWCVCVCVCSYIWLCGVADDKVR